MGTLALKVDGAARRVRLAPQAAGAAEAADAARPRPPDVQRSVRLARGLRMLSLVAEGAPVPVIEPDRAADSPYAPTPEKLALHYRLLGDGPGGEPLQARKAAEQILRTLPAQGVSAARGVRRRHAAADALRPRGRSAAIPSKSA